MARVCLCCRHLKREELDARLLAGDSSTAVAEAYEVSHDSVSRHRHKHLAGPMVAAAEAALAALPDTEEARLERARLALSVAHGSNLLTQLGELVRDASAIQQRAEDAGDFGIALQAVRELTRLIKLAAQFRGELASGSNTQVNVGVAFNADSKIPFEWLDQLMRDEEARTGCNDIEAVFRRETSGFSAAAGDFEALWQFCRQRRENSTRMLLDAHAAGDRASDGPETQAHGDQGSG